MYYIAYNYCTPNYILVVVSGSKVCISLLKVRQRYLCHRRYHHHNHYHYHPNQGHHPHSSMAKISPPNTQATPMRSTSCILTHPKTHSPPPPTLSRHISAARPPSSRPIPTTPPTQNHLWAVGWNHVALLDVGLISVGERRLGCRDSAERWGLSNRVREVARGGIGVVVGGEVVT